MSYIHGRSILLRAVIGMGIVFSLATSSNVHCAPGKDEKLMDEFIACQSKLTSETQVDKVDRDIIMAKYNEASESLHPVLNSFPNNDHENADSETVKSLNYQDFIEQYYTISGCSLTDRQLKQKKINSIIEYINNGIPSGLFDDNSQVINGDGTPPQSTASVYNTPTPDTPKPGQPVPVDSVSKHISNSDNISQTTSNENIYASINNDNLHSSKVKAINKRSVQHDSEDDSIDNYDFNRNDMSYGSLILLHDTYDNDNNDNISQTTSNENIYASLNNDNLHSSKVKAINKRSVQHDSEDDNIDNYDFNLDDISYGNLILLHNTYNDDSNDSIPQTTSNENIYASLNNDNLHNSNDNLHNSKVKAINKRSVQHDSEDDNIDNYDFNRDDVSYGSLILLHNTDNDDSNDSNDKYNSHQDEGTVDDKHLNRHVEITYNVPDQSNDSSNENNSDKSSEGIYVNMERQSNSKDAVDVPDQSNDSSNENNSDKSSEGIYVNMERQSSSKDAVDPPPSQSNGRNDKHNSNQDADDDNETDRNELGDTTDLIENRSDNNKGSQDTNDATASAINVDNHSANNNSDGGDDDDDDDDDDIPNNNIIADENNQLSNTSNLKKAITHEDHATVLQSLFNSTNNIVSQRAAPRLTTDNFNRMIESQASSTVVSQKLVSSGSNMSNVQHEVWIMPLIKKGEKYVDSVSKYTINTYGINIGFDSKIPHYCRGNIESIVGIVLALYNSQLKHTASDSSTLLNTYIISMYYSMIFNQKFFIYTLFSFGTSNAGNYHSTTGVNNTTIYNPEPYSSYNAFRQSAELHAGYNIMLYDSKLHNRQIALMPTVGVQVDTLALHGNTKKHYSFVQQLKLSTGIKVAHHKRIKPSISIDSSLYVFVNYCTWSNTMTYNDQSLISNFENGTLVEKENLATSNNKLSYRIGGDASLQYNRVMYILRYEMNIAQDYLSHQIALKIKLKF